jgi:hypothetical protein
VRDAVKAIAIAPNGDIYIGGYSSLYKSTNGGTNWDNVFYPSVSIEEIVISNFGEVYFGTNMAVYIPNGSGSWRVVTGDDIPSYPIALAPNGILYARDRNIFMDKFYIMCSTDAGNSWLRISISNNLPATIVTGLTVIDNNTIFVGTANAGIFKSIDGGQSWTRFSPTIPGGSTVVWNIVYNSKMEVMFADMDGYDRTTCNALISTDFGESWEVKNDGLSDEPGLGPGCFAVNPITGDTYLRSANYFSNPWDFGGRVYRFVSEFTLDIDLLDFGDVLVGDSLQKTLRIKNNGSVPLVISQVSKTGDAVFTLPNGETTINIEPWDSYNLVVQFSPTDTVAYTGTITLTHNTHNVEGSQNTIQLTGRGTSSSITLSPTIINFGEVRVGVPSQQSVRIINSGYIPLVISQVSKTGDAVFTLPNGETTITIEPGDSCNLVVQFLPTAIRDYIGTITLTHNASSGSPPYVLLTGRGIQASITIDPTNINFGNVNVGDSLWRSVRITNGGNTPLVISSLAISPNDVFTLPNTEPPITVQPNGNCDITVQFSPTDTINYIGTITLTHNAEGSPTLIDLRGIGIDTNVRVAIKDNYTVKPNETRKISVDAINTLTDKNVKNFSFILRYNKRILSFKDVVLSGTLSNSLYYSTEGSTPGELVVKVINNAGIILSGTGSLIDINFIGLRGDSCGTHLFLESFEFNSDGPNAITKNGYCELIGGCGKGETYVTTDTSTRVYQNSPNPIQAGYESTIQYRINVAGETKITVYDILGREVTKLVNEYKSEGIYSVIFNTKGLPSGVYFYRLRAPGYEGLKKMIVIK